MGHLAPRSIMHFYNLPCQLLTQPYLILIALYKSYLTHCVVVCFVLFLKINAQFTLKFLGFFWGPVWPTTWAFGPQTNYPWPNGLGQPKSSHCILYKNNYTYLWSIDVLQRANTV
jgi:hypothetical protein